MHIEKEKEKNLKFYNLKPIISPRHIAIIGASNNPNKIGNVIIKNYLSVGFTGKLYPINLTSDNIMNIKAYKSILDVKGEIDLAVIAIKAEGVPDVLEECGKAHVKGVVVVSSGFAEVGNIELQDKLVSIAKKYNMPIIGPNCLGIMDPLSRNDTLFLPTFKIERPSIGGVSFLVQSGAIGSTILDLISTEGFGLAKFISYGNAAVVDEVDLLNYLADDKQTKVIVLYIEGINRGKEFIEVAKRVSKKKPVIVLKGGVTDAGATAAFSHTASLTGSHIAYEAAFKQVGFIIAHDFDDMLDYAKIFDTQALSTGDRIAVITNGGGAGVLTTDAIYLNNMQLAELSKKVKAKLRKQMPSIVNIRMPLDIGGDADDKRYKDALDAVTNDPNVDSIIVITLFQTPGADEKVADTIIEYGTQYKKPLIVISMGGSYTQAHKAIIEEEGVPVYESPTAAARSLSALIKYARYKNE
ncbi:MAG: acetate--CoA ligase family protein [Candidatus Marsarchaeota archaeon]|jgi:acetyl coenzyme A synthetase (ADP forming)-like protein|nr:acetate--CoA ligase family protein [Candidatus Marsarchaeota archaeon]